MMDAEALSRMKADLLASSRLGFFPELLGVVEATVKLEWLGRRGESRAEYGRLVERMFGAVRDELRARAGAV
jgi:hypothetical protein